MFLLRLFWSTILSFAYIWARPALAAIRASRLLDPESSRSCGRRGTKTGHGAWPAATAGLSSLDGKPDVRQGQQGAHSSACGARTLQPHPPQKEQPPHSPHYRCTSPGS